MQVTKQEQLGAVHGMPPVLCTGGILVIMGEGKKLP